MDYRITTYTGRRVDPFNLRVEDVDPYDIAHSTARLCRYGGHCNRFYSVAEHSVRLLWRVIRRMPDLLARFMFGIDRDLMELCERWPLVHDSTETWFIDLPAPIKMRPEMAFYRDAEDGAHNIVATKFELGPMPYLVHEEDLAIRDWEMPLLFGPSSSLPADFGWTPEQAEMRWLEAFQFVFKGKYL